MQGFDVTTLQGVLQELNQTMIPGRVEGFRQDTPHTIQVLLRTAEGLGTIEASCHPVAARIHRSWARTKGKATQRYPFAQQLFQHLGGQVLTQISQPLWERVAILHFAPRPGDPTEYRLYVEIMGKYSNLLLANDSGVIVCLAHTVSAEQSRVRPLIPGDVYSPPPPLTLPVPDPLESYGAWQRRVALVPMPIEKALLQTYRGVSKPVVYEILTQSGVASGSATAGLSADQWGKIHQSWIRWLEVLNKQDYHPQATQRGYTVLGWGTGEVAPTINKLLDDYYPHQLQSQQLQQERQRLSQVLTNARKKAQTKLKDFVSRQAQAEDAPLLKQKADLIMAYGQDLQPGQKSITLPNFEETTEIVIPLDPAKDWTANAQHYYRRHRKAKRAQKALEPLIAQSTEELAYLDLVASQLDQGDLAVLAEINEELHSTGYLSRRKESRPAVPSPYHRFVSPNGLTILCGRNNRQNEEITFRVAQDRDLWFHAQEIPGSHVLLQVPAGTTPDPSDLQATANVAAHFSRARQSGQVPVLYTPRSRVRKLKGQLPGLVTYSQFQVIWGQPDFLPPNAD